MAKSRLSSMMVSMVFEKIMQPPFSRSRSDLVSLARPFKAGSVLQTLQSRSDG
jgi:hypothetical protein